MANCGSRQSGVCGKTNFSQFNALNETRSIQEIFKHLFLTLYLYSHVNHPYQTIYFVDQGSNMA